jgi:hypothetical protein
MTTAADIVERACRKIGVKAEGETLSADQMAHGLSVLNDMLAARRLDGINTVLPEMAADDEFQLPREFHEGTIYNLAARISPDYMVPAQFDPERWAQALRAHTMQIAQAEMPRMLMNTSSQRRRLRY